MKFPRLFRKAKKRAKEPKKIKYECDNCERHALLLKRYPSHSLTNVQFTCNCRENFDPIDRSRANA